jgi:putative peptidoglycan binding protein
MIMNRILQKIQLFAIAVATATMLATLSPGFVASAQTASPPLAEATIKALQEALNKQGITVNADGVLNEETRAAIRKYQTQHHVPVTGEPDKATLDKLGVRTGAAPTSAPVLAQGASTPPASPSQPQTSPVSPPPAGMMMDCSMMQGQMHTMMQMMQGMMQMMSAQTPPGQSTPTPMQPGMQPR